MEFIGSQELLVNIPFTKREIGFHRARVLNKTVCIPFNFCETRHDEYQPLYAKLEELDEEEDEIWGYKSKYLALFILYRSYVMDFQNVFIYGFNCVPDYERMLLIEEFVCMYPEYLIRVRFEDAELLELASQFISSENIA